MEYFRFTHTPFSMIGTDRLGSAIVRYETSTHVRINYQPFGHQSDSRTGHIGFVGQIKEPKVSSYILGNGYRTYIPNLHRFCSADSYSPFGKGGINTYAYCRADPINKVDPTGHVSVFIRAIFTTLSSFVRGGATQNILSVRRFFEGYLDSAIRVISSRTSSIRSIGPISGSGVRLLGRNTDTFGRNLASRIRNALSSRGLSQETAQGRQHLIVQMSPSAQSARGAPPSYFSVISDPNYVPNISQNYTISPRHDLPPRYENVDLLPSYEDAIRHRK